MRVPSSQRSWLISASTMQRSFSTRNTFLKLKLQWIFVFTQLIVLKVFSPKNAESEKSQRYVVKGLKRIWAFPKVLEMLDIWVDFDLPIVTFLWIMWSKRNWIVEDLILDEDIFRKFYDYICFRERSLKVFKAILSICCNITFYRRDPCIELYSSPMRYIIFEFAKIYESRKGSKMIDSLEKEVYIDWGHLAWTILSNFSVHLGYELKSEMIVQENLLELLLNEWSDICKGHERFIDVIESIASILAWSDRFEEEQKKSLTSQFKELGGIEFLVIWLDDESEDVKRKATETLEKYYPEHIPSSASDVGTK